jgi:glutathione S-transferase
MSLPLAKLKNLALYHYDSCPFCAKTRQAIKKLGLNIELRNIQTSSQHRNDLQRGGHKTQVPCLRLEQANGADQWLYESDDIINFLAKQQNELLHLALTA